MSASPSSKRSKNVIHMPPPHTMPNPASMDAGIPSGNVGYSICTSKSAGANVIAVIDSTSRTLRARPLNGMRENMSMRMKMKVTRVMLPIMVTAPESVAVYRSYRQHCVHTRMAIKPKKQAANLGPYVDLNSCQLVVCTRRAAMEISSFMRPSLFQAHNYSKLAHRIGASALLYMRCG